MQISNYSDKTFRRTQNSAPSFKAGFLVELANQGADEFVLKAIKSNGIRIKNVDTSLLNKCRLAFNTPSKQGALDEANEHRALNLLTELKQRGENVVSVIYSTQDGVMELIKNMFA